MAKGKIHAETKIDGRFIKQTAYQDIFHNSQYAVGVYLKGNHVTINKAYLKLFGYKSEKELIGRPIINLIAPEEHKKIKRNVKYRAEGKNPPILYETIGLRKNGEKFPMEVQVISYNFQGSECTIVLVRDITQQFEVESKIERQTREYKSLITLGEKLGQNLTIKKTAQTAATELFKAVECDTVFVFIRYGDSLHLTGLKTKIHNKEFDEMPIHKVGECMCGLAVKSGKALFSENIFCDERCTWQECKKMGMKSFGAIPLKFGDDIIGVLGLSSFAETNFSLYEHFLNNLAAKISVHINNSVLHSNLLKTADSLRRSERLFRTLASNSTVGIFKADRNGKCDFLNQKMQDLLEINKDSAKGFAWLNSICTEDRPGFKSKYRMAVKAGSALKSEFRVLHKKGNEIWVLFEMGPIKNQEGVIRGFIGNITDVSEEKLPRKMLANSEEKFRAVVQQLTDGIAILDRNGVIIEWNNSLERLTELSRDEMIGKHIWDFEYRMLPKIQQTKSRYTKIKRQVKSLLRSRETLPRKGYERRITTSSGKEKYVHGSLFFIRTSGENLLCSLSRDITEGKLAQAALESSESRYRKLFDSAAVGIGISKLSGEVIAVNNELLKILKIRRGAVPNTNVRGFYKTETDRDKLITEMRSKGSVDNSEVEMIRTDGKSIWAEISMRPVEIDDENLLLVFISDVTERKNAVAEVKKHRQQLRSLTAHLHDQAEEERAIIAREIHDEFGQILTSIKMGLQFTFDQLEDAPDSVKTFLGSEFDSMNNLIDTSMLKLRRLITSLRPDVLDKVGLSAALNEQKTDFASKFKGKINFRNTLGNDKLNPKLEIAIFRIFQEATNNILRHSKAKNVKISVSRTAKNIICKFEDDGIGFDVLKAVEKGSFGLVGIRERAEGWDGRMELVTAPEAGTKLKLTIPAIFD